MIDKQTRESIAAEVDRRCLLRDAIGAARILNIRTDLANISGCNVTLVVEGNKVVVIEGRSGDDRK